MATPPNDPCPGRSGVVKMNIIGENGFAKGDGPPQSSDDVFLLDDSDRRPFVELKIITKC